MHRIQVEWVYSEKKCWIINMISRFLSRNHSFSFHVKSLRRFSGAKGIQHLLPLSSSSSSSSFSLSHQNMKKKDLSDWKIYDNFKSLFLIFSLYRNDFAHKLRESLVFLDWWFLSISHFAQLKLDSKIPHILRHERDSISRNILWISHCVDAAVRIEMWEK